MTEVDLRPEEWAEEYTYRTAGIHDSSKGVLFTKKLNLKIGDTIILNNDTKAGAHYRVNARYAISTNFTRKYDIEYIKPDVWPPVELTTVKLL